MKREWKNFKLDMNKVYMRIGQAVVYISFNLLLSAFSYWGFLQRNDLLGGGKIMDSFIFTIAIWILIIPVLLTQNEKIIIILVIIQIVLLVAQMIYIFFKFKN